MRSRLLRPQAQVCLVCGSVPSRRIVRPSALQSIPRCLNNIEQIKTLTATSIQKARSISNTSTNQRESIQQNAAPFPTDSLSQAQIDRDLRKVVSVRDKLLTSATIPSEREVEEALGYLEACAEILVRPAGQKMHQVLGQNAGSAASALLSIDDSNSTKSVQTANKLSPALRKAASTLSDIAFSIVAHPPVFITPRVLKRYVDLQAILRKPESFPHVFDLYSRKSIPQEGSSPVKYKDQNPNKIANAVNSAVAGRALESALEAKQLVVAMDIVDTTYATKAFRRAKFVRNGLLPVTGFAIAPVAAYAVASQLSLYQTTMDPAMATNVAFAGILAYLGFTTTIGVVAVTTANDQMDRVTWAQGMPLRERWIREDERAAIDKIAGAWGFHETWRRGEEEGEDWDALREWIGRRGMILDRVELMDGME